MVKDAETFVLVACLISFWLLACFFYLQLRVKRRDIIAICAAVLASGVAIGAYLIALNSVVPITILGG